MGVEIDAFAHALDDACDGRDEDEEGGEDGGVSAGAAAEFCGDEDGRGKQWGKSGDGLPVEYGPEDAAVVQDVLEGGVAEARLHGTGAEDDCGNCGGDPGECGARIEPEQEKRGGERQCDQVGLDDYLVKVNAKYNNSDLLNDVIKSQFSLAITKLQALSDPLSTQISNNASSVTSVYTELQKLTVLLKTDMTSSLAILITYGDNDGD